MKCSVLLTALLTTTALAAAPNGPGKPKKPLVQSNQLRRVLTRTGLLEHHTLDRSNLDLYDLR